MPCCAQPVVEVTGGVLADEAGAVNEEWTFAVVHGRPFVTWKCAASLDGRVAGADGGPTPITGPEARAQVHALRSRVGAIIVGTGTVLTDDPHLTVRAEREADRPCAPPRRHRARGRSLQAPTCSTPPPRPS